MAAWLCVPFALAQEVEPSAYDRALDRALAAHAHGAFDVAQTAMEEAHALSANARTWRGLGIIAYERGAYLAAIAPLEAALRATEKPLTPELKKGVEELLERIWQRVARLSLRVHPAEHRVTVDGIPPVLHPPSEIVLLPGQHELAITATGHRPYHMTLHLLAGSVDSLHVVLAPAEGRAHGAMPRAGSSEQASDQGRAASKPDAGWWSRSVRNGSLLVSGGLVLVGGISWLTGWVRFDNLAEDCRQLPAGGCDSQQAERGFEDRQIRGYATAGAVFTAVGVGGLLTAGSLELWHRTRRRTRMELSRSGARVIHRF
jgi:hypothetical protein